ncbi:MAG: hypothetical protein LBH87_02320, partial [Coriobacteriales bacterium]|nr:hypothetical protein [Coriobacteriales bacterium]
MLTASRIAAARKNYPELAATANANFTERLIQQSAGDLSSLINAAISENEASGMIENAVGLEVIADPETRGEFAAAFVNAGRLFGQSPSPGLFAKAGVDFTELAERYQEMANSNLQPKVFVIHTIELRPKDSDLIREPVIDRDTGNTLIDRSGQAIEHIVGYLNQNSWRAIYANLSNDDSIPANPLMIYNDNGQGEGPGLHVDGSIYASSVDIYNQEVNNIKNNPDIHYVVQDGDIWTVALVPGVEEPHKLNPQYSKNGGVHIPISHYLAIQASQILKNQEVIYKSSWMWNNEVISRGSDALQSFYNPNDGRILIYY